MPRQPKRAPVEVFAVEQSGYGGWIAHVRLIGSGKKLHQTDPYHTPTAAVLDGIAWAEAEGRTVARSGETVSRSIYL
jgi:hypothetical protein